MARLGATLTIKYTSTYSLARNLSTNVITLLHKLTSQLSKKELDHLEEIGVLSKIKDPSLWCLPTFCIPKKDSRIRIVSDLRELNKFVKPVQYPLPQISEVL